MEKIENKTSIKSKIINKLLIFTGYKYRYSNEKRVKKYIGRLKGKKYELPIKMGLSKENIKYIDLYSYNGSMNNPKDAILLYIHGGSYIQEAIYLQIKFVQKMADKLNATLLMPIYKTAPKGNYETFESSMDKLYNDLLNLNKRIIIIGDSAGGGLSLSYTMKIRDEKKQLPSNLILFSPWLDMTFSNPEVNSQCKLDNLCSIEGNLYCGKIWAGNIDVNDFRVSPINGNLKDLPRITIITGEYDICKPDCVKLKNKLRENKYDYDYIEYSGQCHNFEIYSTKESKGVFNDVINIIKK